MCRTPGRLAGVMASANRDPNKLNQTIEQSVFYDDQRGKITVSVNKVW